MSSTSLPPEVVDELKPLIRAWRENRHLVRLLALHLDSFEAVPDWLNGQLTYADMLADFAALGAPEAARRH